MNTREELDRLSSEELHDRAVRRAVTHLDVAFMWRLIKAVPVAEAAAGHVDEAETDILSLRALLTDLVTSGDEREVADALRPMYLAYLAEHS